MKTLLLTEDLNWMDVWAAESNVCEQLKKRGTETEYQCLQKKKHLKLQEVVLDAFAIHLHF